jgi:Tfp pilus assembly protein PilP
VKEVTKVKEPGTKPTPLQRFPIDRLKLSVTMTGTASPSAMIEDPEGRGWTVKIGTFVGQNWGKVSSIQRDQIIITETITDHATGRVYPSNIPLRVARDANESKDLQQLNVESGETMGVAQGQGN